MPHETLISLAVICVSIGASFGAIRTELRSLKARLHVAEKVLVEIRDKLLPILANCPLNKEDCPLHFPHVLAEPNEKGPTEEESSGARS